MDKGGMSYVSVPCRKIITALADIGVNVVDSEQQFAIERAVARFWDSHIDGVIRSVSGRTDPDKWKSQGYSYFEKPIWSMLKGRKAAQRADGFEYPDTPWGRAVYTTISNFVLADFNHKELRLIYEISKLTTDFDELSRAIRAARDRGNRNVYYLHGIVSREARQRDGRIAEIRAEAAQQRERSDQQGSIFSPLGAVEQKLVKHDWEQKILDRELNLALERYAKDKRTKSRS